jgi:hypothetical protein
MTTERHDDQRDLTDTLYALRRVLWAFQGLSDALHPDHDLDGEGRANVSHLVSVLAERFSTLLEAALNAEDQVRHPPIIQGPSGPAQA